MEKGGEQTSEAGKCLVKINGQWIRAYGRWGQGVAMTGAVRNAAEELLLGILFAH